MTISDPSRSPTLQHVLDAVLRAELPDKQRAELSSAIRTVGRVLNRPLDEISAEPALLRRRLKDISPIAAGISGGRWANVRSLLRTALATTKSSSRKPTKQPLSEAWAHLSQQLSGRSAKMRLNRLFRYLTMLDIEPNSLTLEHLIAFRQTLHNDALIKAPDTNWRELAWTWNKAARTISGWPDIDIVLERRKTTYSLPPANFPAPFREDVSAYLVRITGADLVEDLPFRPVRPSTRRTREWQLYAAASALVHRGRDPNSIASLANLVEIEAFRDILRFCIQRHGNTPCSAIEQLAYFLKSVARHWVRVDASVLQQMSTVIKRISVRQEGMTPKNRNRLQAFTDPENVLALLHLPERLMREALSGALAKHRAALLAQTAVAIELLLMRPLRIGNLSTLKLDEHVIRPLRSSGLWRVVIRESEVKNDLTLEHELPAESGALLERYLERFRPTLAAPGNPALFPGKGGLGMKSNGTLGGQIKNTIRRYMGVTVNVHLFRHFAGLVHLTEHPGEYSVVTNVLGHKSISTAKRYYTGLETAAAVRHFDNTIADLRARSPSRGTRIPRRLPKHKGRG